MYFQQQGVQKCSLKAFFTWAEKYKACKLKVLLNLIIHKSLTVFTKLPVCQGRIGRGGPKTHTVV